MPLRQVKLDYHMSPEILRAIGDFVVSFAEIEYGLKLGIQTLLGCSTPHKTIITADRTAAQLIETLRELYRTSEHQRVPIATIEELCREADEIKAFRNTLLHSSLTAVDDETVELEKRQRGGQFKLKVRGLDVTELASMTERAQYVAGGFIAIWMGYHEITPRVV